MTNEQRAIRELLWRATPTLSVYRGPGNGFARVDAPGRTADPATVEAVEGYLRSRPYHPAPLAIFASGGTIRYLRSLPAGGVPYRTAYGTPALVAPLLAWLQRHPAYVLVVTDRTGADITAVPDGEVTGATTVVFGPDDEIERNAPGGWSQPRFQRRAEDSWHHNAMVVAGEVTRALTRVGARLLLVAGDVRAVQLMRDALPTSVLRSVHLRQVPGGRQPDGSAAVRAAAVAEAVAAYTTESATGRLKRFIDVRGPSGAAVEGARATLRALSEGRLGTLLVADHPADDRTAWFGVGAPAWLDGEQPTPAAHPRPRMRHRAGERLLRRGRLVDVAIRAAVLTDAQVHVLPASEGEEIAEGIGGLTRFH